LRRAVSSPLRVCRRGLRRYGLGAAGLVAAGLVALRARLVLTRLAVEHQLADLRTQAFTQLVGGAVPAAAARDQRLDFLLDAVFAETGSALVEVALDPLAPALGALEVEVEVHLGEDLAAIGFAGVIATHRHTSLVAAAVPVAERVKPRSAA